jgi:hypothetical protein
MHQWFIQTSFDEILKGSLYENIMQNIKDYDSFVNENFIYDSFNSLNEAGLSRIVDKIKIKKEDFAVLTGWRNSNTFKQNRDINNNIVKLLNSKKMGPYLLIGHWQETTSDDEKDYSSVQDIQEDSILVVRPKNMETDEFIKFITDIGNQYKQDSVLIGVDGEVYLYWDNNKSEKIGNTLTLNKISTAYSQMRNKKNIPFVFEGTIHPTNNMSRMLFSNIGLNWIEK